MGCIAKEGKKAKKNNAEILCRAKADYKLDLSLKYVTVDCWPGYCCAMKIYLLASISCPAHAMMIKVITALQR